MMNAKNTKAALWLCLQATLVTTPGIALAEKSYWRVQGPDDTRFVLKTAMLSPLSLAGLGKSSFFVYDDEDGSLVAYDAKKPDKPLALLPEPDDKRMQRLKTQLTAKLIDGQLKLLMSDGRENIFFIKPHPLDGEAEFKNALNERHQHIETMKREEAEKHADLAIPAQAGNSVTVVFPEAFTLNLPSGDNGFYVHQEGPKQWRLFSLAKPKTNQPLFNQVNPDLTLTIKDAPPKDVAEESRWPGTHRLYEQDGLFVDAFTEYDEAEDEAYLAGYDLYRTVPLSQGRTLLITARTLRNMDEAKRFGVIANNARTTGADDSVSLNSYMDNILGLFSPAQSVSLFEGAKMTLPQGYTAEHWSGSGYYMLSLGKNMVFQSDDGKSDYIRVKVPLQPSQSEFERPSGGIYMRYDDGFVFDADRVSGDQSVLIADDSGLIFESKQDWHLVRYARLGQTHVVYYMNYRNKRTEALKDFYSSRHAFHFEP
ncbi:hypothetical protein [Alloalcanivorax balearicus]|nr:hypothetical protein [Alloalcanivorax balearicus]